MLATKKQYTVVRGYNNCYGADELLRRIVRRHMNCTVTGNKQDMNLEQETDTCDKGVRDWSA